MASILSRCSTPGESGLAGARRVSQGGGLFWRAHMLSSERYSISARRLRALSIVGGPYPCWSAGGGFFGNDAYHFTRGRNASPVSSGFVDTIT